MQTSFLSAALVGVLGLGALACDSDDPTPTETVTATVVADPQLSTLEAAVVRAGLADDLAGAGPFTVFAPTDAAFTALLDALDATPEQLLAREDLGAILGLHVIAGSEVRASALAAGQTVTTLNGQTLTVVRVGTGFGLDTQDAGAEANARITTADIDASNGVVHRIDGVLLPAP